jgi:uncharacterized integral membrane protein (TIGR00697 family)
MRDFDLKATLTVLFAVSIAIANVTASKLAWFELPIIGGVAVPAGFVAFGLAFLCSDLMVEFYGKEYAHKVVNGTIVALVTAYALIHVSIIMPVAPFYGAHESFVTALSSSAGVTIASVITIMVSQHVDVRIFSFFKRVTSGRRRYIRNIGSTSISQAIDTVIFITLAFSVFPFIQGGNVMWGEALVLTIVGQYIVKLVVAGIDTVPFYIVTEFYKDSV